MINQIQKLLGPAIFSMAIASAQPYLASLTTNLLSDATFPRTPQRLYTIKYPDVSGDGYPDLCYMDSVGIQCAIYSPSSKTFGAPGLFTPNYNTGNCSTGACFQTLQYADLNRDGKADICIRLSQGVVCRLSDGFRFVSPTGNQYATSFSDANGFADDISYFGTIRLVDLNADGRPDVCGRSKDGVVCEYGALEDSHTWGFHTGYQMQVAREFSDANGWTQHSYWSTIQFPDLNVDQKADICGRNAAGLVCFLNINDPGVYDNWVFSTTPRRYSFYSDANFWNQLQYYSTIQFADLTGDLTPEVCARGAAGIYCAIGRTPIHLSDRSVPEGVEIFDSTFLADSSFSDANGWNTGDHFFTIRVIDVNGDKLPDICGRGTYGIVCSLGYWNYDHYPHFVPFLPSKLWIDNFGDIDGWNSSIYLWYTVQPVQKLDRRTGNRQTAFCGRGNSGIWCSDYR